ncbi:LanC-like protein 3 [Amphibalanus amphitrite]|uniref:LanC-like protein 3 n=1 Tax=Amphibalanus amphitrite TaxID=1232801 RepID=A0A6A4WL89_AMPAM|nr:LanC-like protein 3 [Amphibalanus amphitrite]
MKVLPQERMFALCDAIVQSGREYSLRQRSPVPLMYAYYDTEYLGECRTVCLKRIYRRHYVALVSRAGSWLNPHQTHIPKR